MPHSVGPDLLRAARAMLDWGLVEASQRAHISIAAVLAAEGRGIRSKSVPASAIDALKRAYEGAGVSFYSRGERHGLEVGIDQPGSPSEG